MAATGNLSISGNVMGQPTGQRTWGPIVITTNNAVDATNVIALNTGPNTVTVPVGATVMMITGPNAVYPTPNPPYTGTLTLKGVAGDTGVSFAAKWPAVIPWDTTAVAPASVVINATVACTVEILFM